MLERAGTEKCDIVTYQYFIIMDHMRCMKSVSALQFLSAVVFLTLSADCLVAITQF